MLIQFNNGNVIIRNMVLDSLVVRYATDGKFMPGIVAQEFEETIQHTKLVPGVVSNYPQDVTNVTPFLENKSIFHPNVIMNMNLVLHSNYVCSSATLDEIAPTIAAISKSDSFALEMQYYIRAILLSSTALHLDQDDWTLLFNRILTIIKTNAAVASDAIYMVLYCLSKETDGMKQLLLLRGLASFGHFKDNIPYILKAYQSLMSSEVPTLHTLAIDLHLRLWKIEKRTYRYLADIITKTDAHMTKRDRWESNIAKAKAINEIGSVK